MSRIAFITYLAFWIPAHCLAQSSETPSSIDFRHHVAPILVEHCLRCHHDGNRQGDISLQRSGDLIDAGYVVAGDLAGSHLLELIADGEGVPPQMPKEGRPLTASEVQTIRQWVAQGADWPEEMVLKARSKADDSWWAYQPIRSEQAHPVGKSPERVIDTFIIDRLREHGLEPSPRADRRTLIRRLSFDLLGLPPSPEAVESFVRDPDPSAYEKLVDRMLESPHYGERYARHWLDLAHYADTHGFERDKRRDHAWRYRDYVIDSFNDDKPYDRFVQEQIAGDVLWPEDPSATIATGFLAAGPWDFVGQVETKSPVLRRFARSLDLDDMMTQVMTSTMAMTVNCARCHDHKLDPISQREYYQLRAVFAGIRREDRVVSEAAARQHERQIQMLRQRLDEIDFEINRLEGGGLDLADLVGGGNGLGSGAYRSGIDARTGKVQTRDFGQLGNVVTNSFSPSSFDFVDGVFIPDGNEGRAEIPVTSTGLTISGLPTTSGMAWDMIRNGPVASQHSPVLGGVDFTGKGHSLLGLHANAGITFDLSAMRDALVDEDPSIGLAGANESARALLLSAKIGYFGADGGNHADAWVFLDGQKAFEFQHLKRADGLQNIVIELPESVRFLTFVSTDGGNGYGHDQIGFGDARVKLATRRELSKEDQDHLTRLRKRREGTQEAIEQLGPPPRFYGVVAESEVPEVRLLSRGDPESPLGEPLAPAAPASLEMLDPKLGAIGTEEGGRRAALARWITDPDNPLFRRVIVNRLWHWHFGTGLVDTPSDFGFGGGRPSHPDLLDWLADELVRQDWSLKAMHRLIVNSETYKQSSHRASSTDRGNRATELDADNRLLWRQNPKRLEAEAVRDSVLLVSGTLQHRGGGPGFEDFEYQDAYAPIYTYVTADRPELWRRSIYRYIVRTTPDQFLTTLDCPDPANLTPKRLTTTTPLQALALSNNEFMLKQSRYFAERIGREAAGDVEGQVRRAFRLALARSPAEEEVSLAVALVQKQGLFTLCRALFNSNEFIYVD